MTVQDTASIPNELGVHFVDIETKQDQRDPLCFTFYWNAESRWEGKDYEIALQARESEAGRKAAHGV